MDINNGNIVSECLSTIINSFGKNTMEYKKSNGDFPTDLILYLDLNKLNSYDKSCDKDISNIICRLDETIDVFLDKYSLCVEDTVNEFIAQYSMLICKSYFTRIEIFISLVNKINTKAEQ